MGESEGDRVMCNTFNKEGRKEEKEGKVVRVNKAGIS